MKAFDLGIRCGQFLSMSEGRAEVQQNMFIGIRGHLIAEIAPWSDLYVDQCARFIDGGRFAAMPGFVNAHTHLAMTLFRGLEDDVTFHRWLFERILPLEAALVDAEFVRAGTELAALECIRFGVTTVNDMYFFAEVAAEVLDRRGLRAWVAQVWADAPLPEDRALGSDKTALSRQLARKYLGHSRITATLGPHAPYTCSDATFAKVAQLSHELGMPIHTHVSETAYEVEQSLQTHGETPVKRLHRLGILGPRTLCAHCVHLQSDPSRTPGGGDIELLVSTGSSVAYNPDSNMKLSSGVAPIPQLRKAGVKVGLGTDGAASNNDLSLFGVMDIGTKLQKLTTGDNTSVIASDALAMATFDGARALGLASRIGSLEVGKEADVILIDLDFPHMQPVHDLRSQLVYSAQGLEVDTVICQGRILLEGKRHVGVDVDRIYADAEIHRLRIAAAVEKMNRAKS